MRLKIRMTVVTWVVVYPMITVLLAVTEPILAEWPLPLRTLLLTVIMVPAMVVWAVPLATAFFKPLLTFGDESEEGRNQN